MGKGHSQSHALLRVIPVRVGLVYDTSHLIVFIPVSTVCRPYTAHRRKNIKIYTSIAKDDIAIYIYM